MIELRKYQLDLLERAEQSIAPGNARVMMQLPTGAGKTVIAAHLLRNYLADGRKAMWITHRRELAAQTRTMLRSSAGVNVSPQASWEINRRLSQFGMRHISETIRAPTPIPDLIGNPERCATAIHDFPKDAGSVPLLYQLAIRLKWTSEAGTTLGIQGR